MNLARNQHIQLLRCWGAGLFETESFYDLCDRKGIMVLQEIPEADAPGINLDIIERSARHFILQMRNHSSLIWWGGGNECDIPYGPPFRLFHKLTLELDGTRPFHRCDPFGGSIHDYQVYWDGGPLDVNLDLKAPFIGEFGLASAPNIESVRRYLPAAEQELWPAPPDGSFWFHTPTFNSAYEWSDPRKRRIDMKLLTQYSGCFSAGRTLADFIIGSQLAQATGIRHTLELARTRWPESTGICYYKLTDLFPACSWATVDYFGVPKIGHYILMDAYQPLNACVLFDRLEVAGEPVSWPVYLLDDAGRLQDASWQISVRAFDARLEEIRREDYGGEGSVGKVREIGRFGLAKGQTQAVPLLIVADVAANREFQSRNYYWLNFLQKPDCLFCLPQTRLSICREPGKITVGNIGGKPAVGVHFTSQEPADPVADPVTAADSYFWLDAGESRTVAVSRTADTGVKAWNAGEIR